ncbi:histidine phosphatase family protein [Mucilaginibacter sp.]|jgi:hypothetical protein|uniref:histidine phosphatase family protein n=1 Tax=Mucilaginibacter sp. TaxID=1882438 RepID=UPI002B7A9F74|nr:histidine phosphatase family protein [Mucilaginibacter sp.]HTI61416.1 hypothetical protein [Mucilaginibacter sp.]
MKSCLRFSLLILAACCFTTIGACQKKSQDLKVVIIRHGEKPADGDNLDCAGFNRSLALPKVLYDKFGTASAIFVPSIKSGSQTKPVRMFQLITPYAVKYNLAVNSSYPVDDHKDLANEIRKLNGVVIVVWEHDNIPKIAKALGIKNPPAWPGTDFDGIWIITYKKDKASLATDKEDIKPSSTCSF